MINKAAWIKIVLTFEIFSILIIIISNFLFLGNKQIKVLVSLKDNNKSESNDPLSDRTLKRE